VAGSISGYMPDPGTKHPHTLRHVRRAEQRGCPSVTLLSGVDTLIAVKLFVREHCQERREALLTAKVSSCDFENGYNFKQQLHPGAGTQHACMQQKGKAGHHLCSLLGPSLFVS